MPARNDKTQGRLLVGMIICILAVVAFSYRDSFIPKPAITTAITVAPPEVPEGLSLDIFDRKDFQILVGQDAVPVRPLQKGSRDAFTASPSGQ